MKSNSQGFFERRGVKGAAISIVILAILLAGWSVWSTLTPNTSLGDIETQLFIDSTNGKTFRVKLEDGMHIPVKSPYSGQETGYKAELCYWTKDGQPKDEPTAVLMNSDIGKPGPTFCPDCGRLVVVHNPLAKVGHKPPPTQAEYMASRNGTANRN